MKNHKLKTKPVLNALLLVFSSSVLFPLTGLAQTIDKLSESKKAAADLAISTLSKRQSIDPKNIRVIHVSTMDWPDSSLGCPQQGAQYLQVVTRGSMVSLLANSKVYRVHIGNKRAIICDKPMKRSLHLEPKSKVGSTMQKVIQTARRDLAKNLNVPITEISIQKVESRIWPNSALGCPVHQQEYKESSIKGYKITLQYQTRQYSYHTDQQKALPCPPIELK